MAVSLSEQGSERGNLHFYDTETGGELADVIPGVHGPTAGGSAAWNGDGTAIFYTRYPREGERAPADLGFFQQIYLHKLGTPSAQDAYEFGKEFPRIAETHLQMRLDGRHILATVANGDGGQYAHYLRDPSGEWKQVTHFEDEIKSVQFGRDPLYIEWGHDDSLYLLSYKNAPNGKILKVPLAQPDLSKAAVVVDHGTNVIQTYRPSASGLYVLHLRGGPSELLYMDYFVATNRVIRGSQERVPSTFQELEVVQGDEIFFRTITYTDPYLWWTYNPSRDRERIQPTQLAGHSPVAFTDVEAVRHIAKSRDGTEVPLTLIQKRGTRLNGQNPVILTGYGGYGVNLAPNFDV